MLKIFKRKEKNPAPSSIKTAPAPIKHSPPKTDIPLKARLENVGANKGNELISLLNIGTTKKLTKGEYLFKAGSAADTGYIVLDGTIEEIAIADGEEINIGSYADKSWINFADLKGSINRESSARAEAPSTVLIINQQLLNSVDDNILLFIYRHLHQSSAAQIARKETEKTAFSKQTQNLVDTLFEIHSKAKGRSKNSELAQAVIQKIPKLPIATIGLLNKLMDDSTSTNEVVELVKSDPSLTSVLLKTLNSAEYNFEEKISDVNHAVSLLGFVGVHQIVMSQSLRKSLPATPAFQKSYTRSLEISHIAFTISQACGIGKPAEMATIGLVHELGNVVIELLRQQNPKLENLIDFFDTSVIGAQLLKTWNLPESIWKTIEYYDFPEFAPPEKITDAPLTAIAVIYLARLCHQRLNKVSEARLPTLFLNDYLGLLNWSDRSLSSVLGEKVVPALRKRGNALPASLTPLLN
ncbi:MAG: HDOD domain-containing protein [Gammaproteobacteria bacterium]|nr:HDOD domain-containing protein [Gammaproteobacteria bacterium]MBQ0841208.1 HDOD domain-containing protein [Gammaproteobacteria bacterium]